MSKKNVEYILCGATFTGILKWLERTYLVKKSGEKFSASDVQGYVRRKALPQYLGGNIIERSGDEYSRLFNIIK